MAHPALPLQKSIIDALKQHDGVKAIVANRVYDHVPASPTYPYVVLASDAYGREIWSHECFIDIQFFSETKGRVQIKRLGEAVVDALDQCLEVEGFTVSEYGLEDLQYFQEINSESQMGEASFRYLADADEDLFEE